MAFVQGTGSERVQQDGPAVFEQMARYHPQEPHWYLYYLAPAPGRQGTGIGSALLRPVLRRCDEQGLPAYLEATSEQNRALYARHGFVDREQYALPDGPPLLPMWRAPAERPRDRERS